MVNKIAGMLMLVLLLTGCSTDQRILDKLGMVQTIALDQADGDKLLVTASIPVIDPNAELKREILQAETNSVKEARLVFSRQTDLRMVSGQMRELLFGIDLAEKGLWKYVETQLRDPSVGFSVKLTVVDGKAGELLAAEHKPHADTGRYITHLLEKEAAGNNIPATTLYEFSRDYNDDGIDVIAPIVADGGSKVRVTGIALFAGDRVVMRVPVKEGLIFALCRGNLKRGEAAINLGDTIGKPEVVVFSSVTSKRKVKVHRMQDGRFKVDLYVSLQGSVLDYTGERTLREEKDRHELEKELSLSIEDKAEQLIRQMQQKKTDALGFGQYVRGRLSYKAWKAMDWRETFPEVEVDCRAKVKIKDYGKYM
ncbi:Ger(x)C family spore germination protein [Paenibacillus tengchongensis]|uniref:Ger(x)C family spore germination protein n=1 Tax=Paenibacillus tengchongensis TaxID=2608684 RepID=UPI00124F5D76|nr:Ger(x)C family spore germination protein [Paenibacillus tengchongensis]